MSVLDRVKLNLGDVRSFGPAFLGRHIARLRGATVTTVNVAGYGPIHVRVGESDVAAVRQIFGEGDYDLGKTSPVTRRLLDRYAAILAQGTTPVIVDAGANIGAATIWFGAMYPEAVVVAIEPEPANAAVLRKNAEGRSGVVVMQAAIGAQAGFVEIEDGSSAWGAQTVRATTGIPVVTVQDAVGAVENGVAFIVKIDIEGFESDLFAANTAWIGDAFAVMVEPHDWKFPGKGTSFSFQKAMAAHDFELFLSGENLIYVRV